jgi:hypothetical protein
MERIYPTRPFHRLCRDRDDQGEAVTMVERSGDKHSDSQHGQSEMEYICHIANIDEPEREKVIFGEEGFREAEMGCKWVTLGFARMKLY